jgi:8-oxo-dGTP pyrophosphatase MutT (NUDIX family)
MAGHHIRVGARALIIQDGGVLLIEFDDETGLHYNLPGGGLEPGESLVEALQREVREEASVEVIPGPLLWVLEYEPGRNRNWAGPQHVLSLIFRAELAPGSDPRLPAAPDPHQTAVRWVSLEELPKVELLPHITPLILRYARSGESGPALLSEPLDPEKAFKYLPGKPPT